MDENFKATIELFSGDKCFQWGTKFFQTKKFLKSDID